MSRFIESVKLQDGRFSRLEYHQRRVDDTFRLFFPAVPVLDLDQLLAGMEFPAEGLFKCRIIYDEQPRELTFSPYIMRIIRTFKLVDVDLEPAVYKAESRKEIDKVFGERGDCDDVLLVRRGLLTDASYSNIALFDGETWFTPRLPVIYGTQRASLIEQGFVVQKDIPAKDINQYQKIRFFNAMIEFGEQEVVL